MGAGTSAVNATGATRPVEDSIQREAHSDANPWTVCLAPVHVPAAWRHDHGTGASAHAPPRETWAATTPRHRQVDSDDAGLIKITGDGTAVVWATWFGGHGVRMTDVATPLTFWRHSRSWRGAFEGWMPSADNFTHHVPKTLPGLGGLYLAGQWVEPGGGVPTALMSGRQLVQILCAEAGRSFVTSP